MINEGKATAILLGIPLSLVVPPVLALLLGGWSPLLWPLTAAAFGVAGAAHGYAFPADGWRLGPCLGVIHLAFIPFGFFLAGDTFDRDGANLMRLLRDVLAFAAPVFAACLGAAAGALVREHRSKKA